jgi:hypothetical protein
MKSFHDDRTRVKSRIGRIYCGIFPYNSTIATIVAKTLQNPDRDRSNRIAQRSHDAATHEHSRTDLITCFS